MDGLLNKTSGRELAYRNQDVIKNQTAYANRYHRKKECLEPPPPPSLTLPERSNIKPTLFSKPTIELPTPRVSRLKDLYPIRKLESHSPQIPSQTQPSQPIAQPSLKVNSMNVDDSSSFHFMLSV